MSNNLQTIVEEIYRILNSPIDYLFKLVAVNKLKLNLNIKSNEFIGDYYKNENSKNNGVVYTPIELSQYIIENTILKEEIVKNPFIKIVDPACGVGNILIPLYQYLYKIYIDNIDEINYKNNISLTKGNLSSHIIKNNIYGYDTDELAVKILKIDLFSITNEIIENIYVQDFLFLEDNEKFDVFLGNPPYIGHKSIPKDYSALLKKKYTSIFKDKGDLFYCFFQNSLDFLEKRGKLSFITSRYFLEAKSGEELRKVLKEVCTLNCIVDFYGLRPFKSIGIDPAIIFLTNESYIEENIKVIKPNGVSKGDEKDFYEGVFLNKGKKYKEFYINKNSLNNKGWILRNEEERNIIRKIEEKSFCSLQNICDSYQGIITGCDKAFIVSKKDISEENLEVDIIKPWIKSSYISKFNVTIKDKFIIYSDSISNIKNYKNNIKHIEKLKWKLLKRRECVKGIRKWYELQWGRKKEIFENEKIVFPYKSSSNKFSYDKGSYFSADVYCMILKENVPFSYDYLLYILNSKTYEYYFKTFGKKLGAELYEYYPNNLMKLCIPVMMDHNNKEEFLYKYFNFSEREIYLIENSIK